MENEEEEGDDWRVVKETSGKRARCLAAVIATAHHRRIPVFFQAAAAKRQSTRSLCHAHPDATAFLLRCPFSTRFLYSRNVIFRDTTARECVDCVSRTLTCRKCKPATLFWREADHLAELDWADEASGLTAVRVGCWVRVCVRCDSAAHSSSLRPLDWFAPCSQWSFLPVPFHRLPPPFGDHPYSSSFSIFL